MRRWEMVRERDVGREGGGASTSSTFPCWLAVESSTREALSLCIPSPPSPSTQNRVAPGLDSPRGPAWPLVFLLLLVLASPSEQLSKRNAKALAIARTGTKQYLGSAEEERSTSTWPGTGCTRKVAGSSREEQSNPNQLHTSPS